VLINLGDPCKRALRQTVGDIRRGRQGLGLERCRSCDRKPLGQIVTIQIYSPSGRHVPETRLLQQRARIPVQLLGAIRILILNTFNYTSKIKFINFSVFPSLFHVLTTSNVMLEGSNPTWGMDVCCEFCVLSSIGLCDELITHSEESYRLWCVVMFDLETS
jgi:hypothetical protein